MMSVRCGDSNLFIVWLTIYWYGSKSIGPSVRLHHLAANQLISLSDVTLNVLNYTLQLSIIVIQRYKNHDLYKEGFNQHSFWTLKVKNHDLYKEGFVGVNLTQAQVFDHGGEISFTGAAFQAIFEFLRFTCFKLFLLYVSVTFGQEYSWTLR